MGCSSIDTILDELKTEMEEKIVGNSTYYTQPHIARGVHTWDDTDSMRPFIWFISTDDIVEETMSNRLHGYVVLEIHGYAETDGNGNSEWMHKLLKDVKYFLYNDYTRSINMGNTILYEGGVGDTLQMSGFVLTVSIVYSTTTTVI